MEYLIQKFGGTSLGRAKGIDGVADIIKSSSERHKVVAVVSAISSYDKKHGTTSKLLAAKEEARTKGAYAKIVDQIEEDHLSLVNAFQIQPNIKEGLKDEIAKITRHLKSFLSALQIIEEVTGRSEDAIIGNGEKLSALILTAVLNSKGVDAEYVNLAKVLDFNFSEPDRSFYEALKNKMRELVVACEGKIPVVTGFFGHVPGGIIETVGRGYTDLTAALLAVKLKAKELQIWKEVDGIFSADPNKVPEAALLPTITPEEAAELTYFGSEVLHPFTLEHLARAETPVRIMNTFKPSEPGTLIAAAGKNARKNAPTSPATAVTCKKDIQVVNIFSNRMLLAHGFMAKVFDLFKEHKVVVDLVATTECNISLTVKKGTLNKRIAADLEKLGTLNIQNQKAILSLVGVGMKSNKGMAGTLFKTLAENDVNIEMISQGASEINISCVINENDALKALRCVHENVLARG